MSLTRQRLETLHRHHVRRVRLGDDRRRSLRRWLGQPQAVSGQWGLALAGAWLATALVGHALDPPPARAGAAPELAVWAVTLGLGATLAAAGLGLARGQRLGLLASAAAAGFALVDAVACPLTGHHSEVGAWWYASLAGYTAVVGLSLVALVRSRAGAPGPRPEG